MQAYPQQAFAQPNKGTLVPGQSITVNKYTVTVERYLSQGGFAHIYLVRTAQPLYNTTHHVLKRIAVPNEAMLSEVKKEVDIMRILRGHPNIVFLIDAAWHRMANGTYEVFILMEYCPGGGLIDMMNRRLRERLTEAEILTIFVDVCEGLAAMHALKPPILHRDLKVENILQASPTSYKLCDFGSATPVQKVPSNTQELRMLEADLNRHTTLQYRAPEMIDVHLRRPIDEKSDVWALGVLLYKLCYYTTPFEEHGPLAILNVQYKIPPYPVYSSQMNALIASMLKEHGAQRPSVFEILQHVHALRGTKSRFTYNVPPREPLSPRGVQAPLQALSPNVASNPLEDLVSFKSQSPAKNVGVEAREKVLEAIAPMRRGRPQQSHPSSSGPSRPSSPEKPITFETRFGGEDDRAWKALRPKLSTAAGGSDAASMSSKTDVDAWSVDSRRSGQKPDASERRGFEGDFSAGFGSKFTSAHQSGRSLATSKPAEGTVSGFSSGFGDAFDPSKAGAASARPPSPRMPPSTPPTPGGLGTSNTTYRPPSVHATRPTPSPQLPSSQVQPQSSNLSPIPPPSQPSWRQHEQTPSSSDDPLAAEERFPSLEDLDRKFGSPSPNIQADKTPQRLADRPPSRSSYFGSSGTGAASGISHSQGLNIASGKNRYDGVRSQHVTGTAMRETRPPASRQSTFLRSVEREKTEDRSSKEQPPLMSRPSLSRRHRSSVSMKSSASPSDTLDLLTGNNSTPSGSVAPPPSLPSRPQQPSQATPRSEPRDWLTGADDDFNLGPARATTPTHEPQPVLRESPSKRASYIERSPIALQKPLEAESVDPSPAAGLPQMTRSATTELEREWNRALDRLDRIPAGKSEREKEREGEKERVQAEREAAQRKLERRRSPSPATTKAFITRGDVDTRGLGLQIPPVQPRAQSTTPSPSGLTDNWSPVPSPGGSSDSDNGPEDLNGYKPFGKLPEKPKELQKGGANGGPPKEGERRRRARSKGRQSSVHDLVDLWGGGVERDKEKPKASMGPPPPKRSSILVPAATMKPPLLTNKPRPASPQPVSTPTGGQSSKPMPSPSKHMKLPSAVSAGRRLPIPPSPSPSFMETSIGRSRPASMFISPVSASRSTPAEISSSTEAAASFAQQALSPPDTPRSRRSTRRSSISDMVQLYETIGSSATGGKSRTQGPGPGPPAKPAGLTVKTHQATNSAASSATADMSPSAAATRFPKLSPTSSPVLGRANLAVPEDTGRGFVRDFAKHRTSPTGLPSRSSPVGRLETPYTSAFGSNTTGTSVNGLPSRRSPLEPAREQQPSRASMKAELNAPQPQQAPPSPRMERKPSEQFESASVEGPGVRSPSPEKPFQGVSKLIDKWQRAVDETTPAGLNGARRGGVPARRAGMVSGGAGRN
ncbi:hypothetical protein BN946_scf185013.g39 [Trametes cinnabarina]|uniref:non-specific serine/threonine protein kinase n=1 Tax=Pycnoporus cinnabarinus TaxID=5643 RepID=A0A060SGA5_PYCCI|nr:hypothetical protein BN946_scf185013.g39 [Trametes cinnabarina]